MNSFVYILSYWSYNNKKSFVGGLRPYKLNQFLRNKGVNSILLVPIALKSPEFVITKPKWIDYLGKLKKIFPPDPSIFWACKVAFELRSRNKGRHFFILTTCPPNGLVLAGLILKMLKVNFTWILDFRDIWTKHPIYNPPITKKYIDPYLERLSNKQADLIIANTEWDKQLSIRQYPFTENKICTIRNGFDRIIQNTYKENKNTNELRFIYTGGTTAGQATFKISFLLKALNQRGISAFCDFYGEFDEEMSNCKFIKYHGTVSPELIPRILSNYRYGFIYLPEGSESGGRVAQKFYDYLGAGVIPVCIRPSKEMQNLMNEINTGIPIDESIDIDKLVRDLKEAEFRVCPKDLVQFTRDYQFGQFLNLLLNMSGNNSDSRHKTQG